MTTLVKMFSKIVSRSCVTHYHIYLTYHLHVENLQTVQKQEKPHQYIKLVTRPISVLPCFSKILECSIYDRIYTYLQKTKILYYKQLEFQAEHSTDHAIIQMLDQIYENFEENKYTLGVFVDLSQTFDTADHKKLLSKLEIYGIK